jgi:hypothetical protein
MSAATQHRRDCASVRHVMARQRADQLGNPNAPHRFGTPSAESRGIRRAGFNEGWQVDAIDDYSLEAAQDAGDMAKIYQNVYDKVAKEGQRFALDRHPRYAPTGANRPCPRKDVWDDRFSQGALTADLYRDMGDDASAAAARAEHTRVIRAGSDRADVRGGFRSRMKSTPKGWSSTKMINATDSYTSINPAQLDLGGKETAGLLSRMHGGSAAGGMRSARTDHAAVTARRWGALPGGLRRSHLHPGATADIRRIALTSADSGAFRDGGFGQDGGPSATAGCDQAVQQAQMMQRSRAHASAGGITASRGSIIQ